VPDRLVIEIPVPRDQLARPTTRTDWVQGVMESALKGVGSWLHGADLGTEPTIYLDPVIVPKTEEAPF
jgi:hypothetical protein